MELINKLPNTNFRRETAITIGNFDGVHVGHRQLIRRMVASAERQNLVPAVVTFHPHPQKVLHPDRPLFYLTSVAERLSLLETLGVQLAISIPFSLEVARLTPEAFIQRLTHHLHMRELWVGPDFALGKGRIGDIPYLHRLGEQFGYRLFVVPPFVLAGEEVHSSVIRRALAETGAVGKVSQMLGYPYYVAGKVVAGDGRGREIGVPTANVACPAERLLPANGVYATWTLISDRWWPGVTNVGVRPTVGAGQMRRVETHLFGFQADIYGEQVRLTFLQRLRGEQRFPDFAALRTQIETDKIAGAAALAKIAFPPAQRAHFETLPNGADRVVRIEGETRVDLFREIATTLYSFLHQPHGAKRIVRRVTLQLGSSLAGQLDNWIETLLGFSAEQGELYDQFIVLSTAERVDAYVGGWAVDSLERRINITDLRIEQRPDRAVRAVVSFTTECAAWR